MYDVSHQFGTNEKSCISVVISRKRLYNYEKTSSELIEYTFTEKTVTK